ncbi:MAG TPA: hypothetical protein VFV79_07755 [Saprospiraceae bacterium]|nr:hypothetical protein [Saprospiraceae bacterium]
MREVMNFLSLSLILSLSLLACEKKPKPVEYRLTDDKLTHLMYDVQYADAAITGASGKSADTLRELLWTRLTTIYGLSEKEIKSEINKLQTDPEKMKIVFDSIKAWSDTIR